jgi:hypothetical protein
VNRAERHRRLVRENEFLREHRRLLERLLARTLEVAVGGTNVKPLVLLAVLEDLERRSAESPADLVVRVLRETAT